MSDGVEEVIAALIERYEREQDFYRMATQLCAQLCEFRMDTEGIRAIVTSRAKALDRLRDKIRRLHSKEPITTIDECYSRLNDLAGVRIALYFPGDRVRVDTLLRDRFIVHQEKNDFSKMSSPIYKRRFAGYVATHYQVSLRQEGLLVGQLKYATATIEVQVASLLMHAWSEVEHDLVYKPFSGELSLDEYSILDELNGMVQAGEIALERLQRAVEQRIYKTDARFSDSYELSSYLSGRIEEIVNEDIDITIGRSDILFSFFRDSGIDSPRLLEPLLLGMQFDLSEPIDNQLVDRILMNRPELEARYIAAVSQGESDDPFSPKRNKEEQDTEELAFRAFMSLWIALEAIVRSIARDKGLQDGSHLSYRIEDVAHRIAPNVLLNDKVRSLNSIRNGAIHGLVAVSSGVLIRASKDTEQVITQLVENFSEEEVRMVREILQKRRIVLGIERYGIAL